MLFIFDAYDIFYYILGFQRSRTTSLNTVKYYVGFQYTPINRHDFGEQL